jgi:hypothetical protein
MAPGYNITVRAMAKKPGKWTSKTRHRIKPQKGEIISEGQTIFNFATQLGLNLILDPISLFLAY